MKCESSNCQNEVHTLNDNGYYCWKCIDDAIVNKTFKLPSRDSVMKVDHSISQDYIERVSESSKELLDLIPETTPEEYKAFIKKARSMTLPTDSAERKNYPLLRGCLKYFSAALAGVARISKLGNDKHNPGEDMHHARGKSSDHGDCIIRHLMDTEDLIAAQKRGDTTITDQQILDEANQMAWRALAYVQELHEAKGAPMASGARK